MARIGGREFMELVELELGLEGGGRTEAREEYSTGEYQEQKDQNGCGKKDSHSTTPGHPVHVTFSVNGALWTV